MRRGLILFQKASSDENVRRGLGHMIKAIERRYGLEGETK